MPDPERVHIEAEELRTVGVQPRRQRQEVVDRRGLDHRRRRSDVFGTHLLHRVEARAVVAVIGRDHPDQLRIDGERCVLHLGHLQVVVAERQQRMGA